MTKVLIADDHIVTRKLLQTTLEKNGYTVIAAKDGFQAWEMLTQEPDIRLAILDWMMPGMSGVDICVKLEQLHKSSLIYVILLTAKEGTDNITAALQAGANDYVTKPFQKEELLARLKVGERMIELQSQLTQAQKLESIGQLAAGIAHEINTPAQYIGDNIQFILEAYADGRKLLEKYCQIAEACRSIPDMEPLVAEIDSIREEIDAAFLVQELPKAINQSREGIEHVSHIVRAMKEFAHPGTNGKQNIDINKSIQSTITISHNKWKDLADLETNLEPEMPLVSCLPIELNQVILALIINAADAISDAIKAGIREKGKIVISSYLRDKFVEIRIADTGTGIPENIRDKIYNPFFTTKDIGVGMGQGLAISHTIIVDKHQGTLTYETQTGEGTTFIIRLPLQLEEKEMDNVNEYKETNTICR
jgi:signal transduction histidine kinase